MLPGARRALVDLARTILAAEAVGVARESTDLAAEYAKERQQFGRPIAMFQAVKHHCANMAVATELATAAVWDAARAAAGGGDQFSYAAAVAAALAVPAADECANLGMQVHGGIGFTWEHDCHLYLRRATAIGAVLDADDAAVATTDLTRQGVRRERTVDLPPEAEPVRDEVRAFVAELRRARRRRPQRPPDRQRLRHAALADAVRPRRRRHRAARHRAGVRRRRRPAPAARHHRLGHPDADPARHGGAGRRGGCARR